MSFAMNQTTTTKPETFMLTADQLDNLPVEAKQALEQVDDLKYFLATAPANWQVDQIIRRYLLPTGEYVSCVLWRNLFHVTGTDIVRALTYRFQAFGRPVRNIKKFEEGIFSDLRNLKPGTDASLEEPKSAFLDLLYKNNCIRTQKKQKVFYWFSVPHDRLFLDALERDLKRERMGTEATTMAVQEPALSFVFDATQSLYEQLTKSLQHNAATEVGASLAAQQAQHNLIAAQYQGSMPPFVSNFSSQPGPSESYHRRSQSIQSAVPIDYRSHSTEHQSTLHSQLPPGYEAQRSDSFHLGRSFNAPAAVNFHNYSDHPNELDGLQPDDYARQRAMSYDEAMQMPFPTSDTRGHGNDTYGPEALSRSVHAPRITQLYSQPPPPGQYDLGFDAPGLQQQHYQEHYIDEGYNAPHGFSASLQGFGPDQETLGQYTGSPRARGLSLNHNMFEGSPTYKQRRRRQSIPSSILLAEQEAQAQDLEKARTATEPNANDPPRSQLPKSSPSTPPETRYDSGNSSGAYKQDYELSYQHDLQIAELERCDSRDGSERSGTGSPYSIKNYSCPYPSCVRLFNRLEHLKRHVRTHTQERPFHCDCCDKRFSRSDNLAQHRKAHERQETNAHMLNPESHTTEYQHRQTRNHYETVNSLGYEDMSDYSDPDRFRTDESQGSNFVPGSFASGLATSSRPPDLEHYDMSNFSIQQRYHGSQQDDSIGHNAAKFHSSLNPPSPRSRSIALAGDQSISPHPSSSVTSIDSINSHAYIPSSGGPPFGHKTAAPRMMVETRSWNDSDATPRQDHFSGLTPTFNHRSMNGENRQW